MRQGPESRQRHLGKGHAGRTGLRKGFQGFSGRTAGCRSAALAHSAAGAGHAAGMATQAAVRDPRCATAVLLRAGIVKICGDSQEPGRSGA
jgi:hypothetical protein